MYRLLDAGFTRLRKSKVFYLLLIYTVGIALFIIGTQYFDMKTYDENIQIDQLFLNNITIIGIVIAIFTSLFIGTEYSDGTIRNKIIVSASRTKIYLANLLIVMITTIVSEILYLIIMAIIGIPIFGGLNMSMGMFAMIVVAITGIVCAFSAIFTFIAMIVSNKTMSSILSIMLSLGLMMASLTLIFCIEAPEYVDRALITNVDTQEIEMIKDKNPRYLTDEQRRVYQVLVNFIPSGQAFLVAGRSDVDFNVLPIYSLIEVIFFTGMGIYIFNKKELM